MNLFICTTTFQVTMAKCIIKNKEIKDNFVIYLKGEINERDMKQLSELSVDYKIIRSRFDQIKLLIFLLYKSIGDIYISSIDNEFIWLVCSLFKRNNIYSFDDGTANYIKSGFFYENIPLSKDREIIFQILNLKVRSIIDIKRIIKKHYAFCGLENIIDNVEVIDVVDVKNKDINPDKKVDVFILPCISEFFISPDIDVSKIKKLINEDTILVTHPRDQSGLFSSTYKMNDSAEDIIFNLLTKGYFINLYGYANSTQLIYAKNPNLTNKIIITDNIPRKFINGYVEQIEIIRKICKSNKCEFIKI